MTSAPVEEQAAATVEPGMHKGFVAGTHRAIAPEATLARVMPLMPVLGITRIANVTGLDTIGVPVVMVTRPNAKSLSVAQGKGLTLAAARVSGLMESVESYHAENITLPLKLASYKQLSFGHRLVDIAQLPRYAGGSFHADERTLWIEGLDLMDGDPRWLPHALVHTDFTLPLPPGSGTFIMTSSGLASGNHPLEAVCHAVCELIERDAVTLWRLHDAKTRRATRLDLGTVDDLACREILLRFERAGISTAVWNVTSDVGVAAFHAVIVDREPNLQRSIGPMGGMGCHPSREIALLRALTEAAQSRLTLISGARDDLLTQRLGPDEYLRALRRFHAERVASGARAHFQAVPTRHHERFDDELRWLLGQLHGVGCTQVVAVDLTRRELGVPVVRVVIPGLEVLSDLPGYLPGRRAHAVKVARAESES